MTPNEILFAHRYAEAVHAFRKHLIDYPDQNYYDGLGEALLCVGSFAEAAASFKKANEIESRRLKGNESHVKDIGTALWLCGDKAGAMDQWHYAVKGVLDRTILYGDGAGGASQGLLLWYAGVSVKNYAEAEYALKYFKQLKQRKTWGMWPRPVYLLVLGELSFEEILMEGAGSSDLAECIRIAKSDLLKRRQLCQALFYGACLDRQCGDETACMEKMRACCELENPIIEVEWYLARGECAGLKGMN